MARSIFFLKVAVLLSLAQAATALELVPPTDAQLLDSQELPSHYRLALDTLRNVNGRWQPAREQALTGAGTRTIFEFPRGANLAEISGYYQRQLQLLGAAPLFVCVDHRCGSSASWANEFFSERRLYGLDQYQRYAAYKLAGVAGDTIVVLYAVTRGNQRSFLLVDLYQSDKALQETLSIDSLRTLLNEGQKVEVPLERTGQQWQVQASFAELMTRLLKIEPTAKLALVVSDHRSNRLQQNLDSSREIGQQIAEQLAGANADRLRVEGIGNLNPQHSDDVAVWFFRYQ